ncbi:hypothetical protein [Nonomuraea candida]|uniref:hypothetical protein n=1 Tax=Nonomuraea candida TaxID=359159 RepID=UPI0012FB21FF|nr:hypothetical protein [Nonomuraea candida]
MTTTAPHARAGHGEQQVERYVPEQSGYDPSWIDHKEPVTVRDIRLLHRQALDAGCDPEALRRGLEAAVREAGGIEELARRWRAGTDDDRQRLRDLVARYPDLAREALGGGEVA